MRSFTFGSGGVGKGRLGGRYITRPVGLLATYVIVRFIVCEALLSFSHCAVCQDEGCIRGHRYAFPLTTHSAISPDKSTNDISPNYSSFMIARFRVRVIFYTGYIMDHPGEYWWRTTMVKAEPTPNQLRHGNQSPCPLPSNLPAVCFLSGDFTQRLSWVLAKHHQIPGDGVAHLCLSSSGTGHHSSPNRPSSSAFIHCPANSMNIFPTEIE